MPLATLRTVASMLSRRLLQVHCLVAGMQAASSRIDKCTGFRLPDALICPADLINDCKDIHLKVGRHVHKADYIFSERRVLRNPPFSCEKIAYVIGHRETIVIHFPKARIPGGKANRPELT